MGAFLIIFDFETWMSDKGPDELHVDGCPGCLRGLRCHSGGRFGTILGACVFGAGAEVLRALGSLVGAQDVSEAWQWFHVRPKRRSRDIQKQRIS